MGGLPVNLPGLDAVKAELQRLRAVLGRQDRDECKAAADERAKQITDGIKPAASAPCHQ